MSTVRNTLADVLFLIAAGLLTVAPSRWKFADKIATAALHTLPRDQQDDMRAILNRDVTPWV